MIDNLHPYHLFYSIKNNTMIYSICDFAIIDGSKYIRKAGSPDCQYVGGYDRNKVKVIADTIENEIGVSISFLSSRKYFFYRAACVYLLRLYVSDIIYKDIAKLLGYKEHSAPLHACGSARDMLVTDYKPFSKVYNKLLSAVKVALLEHAYTVQENPAQIPKDIPSTKIIKFTFSETSRA